MDWLLNAPNTLLGRSADRGLPSTLTAFYRSGAILAHYSTDRVLRDGAGAITAFPNLGGAGALLNSQVVGPELTQQRATAVFPPENVSFVQLPAPLDLIGVRLMWLMSSDQITTGMRLFSHEEPGAPHLRFNVGAGGIVLLIVQSATAVALNPRTVWPSGLALYELEMTETTATLFINKAVVASAEHAFPAMPVSRIGIGHSTNLSPFVGRLGEILGVILGLTDTGAAIATARARLNARLLELTPIASGAAISGLPAVPAVAVTPTFDGVIIGAS